MAGRRKWTKRKDSERSVPKAIIKCFALAFYSRRSISSDNFFSQANSFQAIARLLYFLLATFFFYPSFLSASLAGIHSFTTDILSSTLYTTDQNSHAFFLPPSFFISPLSLPLHIFLSSSHCHLSVLLSQSIREILISIRIITLRVLLSIF
ncbi:unnamed protein product [Acanthosepion pharaonis]|uniref:Uncharacterized protein n=1 Tax=Acanthosepion pharaonis TaxID=158019 RepID=A0A812AL37_ACAPH|nr:unnamed protein product [Sepia pharaonis]